MTMLLPLFILVGFVQVILLMPWPITSPLEDKTALTFRRYWFISGKKNMRHDTVP